MARWMSALAAVLAAASPISVSGCEGRSVSSSRVTGPAGVLAVEDGGQSLQRAERGDGLPVVLVHSLAGNTNHWAAQLEHLRPSRRAVAIDLRGHGQSDRPKNGDYSIAGMAGDIAAVVDTLGLQRFVLVGHSMGGGVALAYAGAHPEQVAGLLLVDPIGDGKQIPTDEAKSFLKGIESSYPDRIQEYWAGIAGPDSAIRERLLADLRATPREAVVQVLRSVMQFDPHPLLERYRGPALSVVTPANDQGFSLHRIGKGFPHQVMTGTGHWIQLDRPEEFNHLLDEFLETVERKDVHPSPRPHPLLLRYRGLEP
jgi:pimeloyl-ACP methyl ester carboxylesterase